MKKIPLLIIVLSCFSCFLVKAQVPYEPAVTNIQIASSSACLDSIETIIVTINNMGAQVLDLSVNGLVVYLNVSGPNGTQLYSDTLTSGLMLGNGAVGGFTIFSNINFSVTGCYSINTDSLKLIGSNYMTDANDSLFSPLLKCRGELQVATTNVNCNGNNNGQAIIQNCRGSGIVTAALSPLIGTQSPVGTFSNLPAGAYMAIITDSNNTTDSTTFTILEPPSLSIDTIMVNHVLCNGDNTGSVVIMANGGTPPIQFSLSPNIGFQAFTGTFQGLSSGTYTSIGVDANGCSATAFFTITDPSAVQITNVSTTNPSCLPGGDGTITVTASGGVGSLQYRLDAQPFQSSNHFTGLSSGTISITVMDANGCSIDTSISLLIASNNLAWSSGFALRTKCHGDSTGTVSVQANGGKGTLVYSLVSHATSNLNGTFSGLPAGAYTIVITDANLCSVTVNLSIPEPDPFFVRANVKNTSCPTVSDGQIDLYPWGPVGAHTYSLSGNFTPTGIGRFYENLPAGTYNATITNTNNCKADTTIIVGSDIIELRLAARINESCIPGKDGLLRVFGFPANSNYLYSIDSVNWHVSGEFKNLNYGLYKTYVQHSTSGCVEEREDFIEFNNNLPLTDVITRDEICFGQNNGQVIVPANNYTYSIIPIAGQLTPTGIINIPKGIYTLTAQRSDGCLGEKVIEITAADSMWISNLATTNSNTHCYGTAIIEAVGGAGNLSYGITPKAGAVNSPGNFDGLCWGTYSIFARDQLGCKVSSTFKVAEDAQAPFNMFDHVTVYPNPADNVIYFKSDYLFDYEISLINLMGQCVAKKDIYDKNGNISTANLVSGIYILRFKSQVDHADKKIIIQH